MEPVGDRYYPVVGPVATNPEAAETYAKSALEKEREQP